MLIDFKSNCFKALQLSMHLRLTDTMEREIAHKLCDYAQVVINNMQQSITLQNVLKVKGGGELVVVVCKQKF
ncbi:CLUMA_CG015671, isoform A [Clunio marinus]|uniref:CLUMA_CG015671, isoform A n=1 Tax=Clunio marinus TaxID=568069 RepID=A0A1J1IPG7_9DIPT|nr:CLUMA_CG015671, isoform A [Clunio marinus]